MAAQAIGDPHGHLLGDVPALFIVAIVLAVLMPRQRVVVTTRSGGQRRISAVPTISPDQAWCWWARIGLRVKLSHRNRLPTLRSGIEPA